MSQQRSWPDDPRLQMRIATATFVRKLYAASRISVCTWRDAGDPPRRRIGFTFDR